MRQGPVLPPASVFHAGLREVPLAGGRGVGGPAEGDIYVVESAGDRLDLSGVEVGGRLFLLASKFGGVRVDRPDLLKKIVVL